MAAQDRLLTGESQALIAIVEELAEELRQGTIRCVGLTLSSSLDRDVGLDSLGRVELLARIERRLGVHLPEQIAVEAQTIGDLLQALHRAGESLARPSSTQGSQPDAAPIQPQPRKVRRRSSRSCAGTSPPTLIGHTSPCSPAMTVRRA